jgi:nucleotide-binding universal stress UspA family protein
MTGSKILVPLDGSKLARAILEPVGLLATAFGHDVEAVRVLDAQEIEDALLAGSDIFEDVKQDLLRSVARLDRLGIVTHTETLEGEAGRRILDYAEEIDPAIIAIATHGKTGADSILRGSVAEQILRGARHPVFVANPFSLSVYGVSRILVPLDGSERSERILPLAESTGLALDAELVLFHALDATTPFSKVSAAETHLESLAERLGGRTRVVVKKCPAGDGILSTARTEQADLIAIATHGRTGLERLQSGSTMEYVVGRADAPLLVQRTAGVPAIANV